MEECLTNLTDAGQDFTDETDQRCRNIINAVARRFTGTNQLIDEVRP